MEQKYTVPLARIVEEQKLEIINASSDFDTALISCPDVNRPGLQLIGFYDYFDPRRIQIIGIVETTFLETMTSKERSACFEKLFSRKIAALIICHKMPIYPECVEMARKYDINLFSTEVDTSEFMARIIGTLKHVLAPRIQMHGVLVEVYGEGLLITGDSGVGKSETALELIKRGHRLIADDAVVIKRPSSTALVGSAPELTRYYMEVRGIGIIDVRRIFGISAVKPTERIDLLVHLENWDEEKIYDRLGIDSEYTDILGVRVPSTTIPVRTGRNLAVILEIAAINHRQKQMGYNAARELTESHDRYVDKMDRQAETYDRQVDDLSRKLAAELGAKFE